MVCLLTKLGPGLVQGRWAQGLGGLAPPCLLALA